MLYEPMPLDAPRLGALEEEAALACGCLEGGLVAVLLARRVALWAPCDDVPARWQCILTLDGSDGARFHTLALLDPTLRARVSPQPLLAACGFIGVSDGVVDAHAPVSAPSAACGFGASIFRLDHPAVQPHRKLWCSVPLASSGGVTPPRLPPARHVGTQDNPTCAKLLRCSALEDTDEPDGTDATLLAIGGADGVVRLWRLTYPPSEACTTLPVPHAERPSLRGASADGAAADGTAADGGDGACAVLSLCGLPGELGLLVGGFRWGAALWQVGARVLVNIFEREGYASAAIRAPLFCGATYQQTRPANAAAAQTHAANVAALVVALPPTSASRGAPRVDAADNVGRLVVGSACGWLLEGALSPSLARTFQVSRGGCLACEPSFREGEGESEDRRASSDAPTLVSLASDGVHLAGADSRSIVRLWSAWSGECLAALHAFTAPVPAVLSCVLSSATEHRCASGVVSARLLLPCAASSHGLHRCTLRWSASEYPGVDAGASMQEV